MLSLPPPGSGRDEKCCLTFALPVGNQAGRSSSHVPTPVAVTVGRKRVATFPTLSGSSSGRKWAEEVAVMPLSPRQAVIGTH